MIDKRKHLYFTKRVEDKFLNMNADVTMNVEADSREVTKVFEKWVKKINEAAIESRANRHRSSA